MEQLVIEQVSSIMLFLFALFSLLWYVTPTSSTYETVEADTVVTRKVFRILALVSGVAWVALLFAG